MKRQFALIALLFCGACNYDITSSPIPFSKPYVAPTTPKLSLDNPDDAAKKIVAAINKAFEETGTPTGAIYGHWRNESGELYGDGGRAGRCSALEQYQIMAKWKPEYGKANIEALAYIAKRQQRDMASIKGSCGNSTLQKRGPSFGGAIGPAQIMAEGWVKDSLSKDKDIFNLLDTLPWIGRRDRRAYDRAPKAFQETKLTRWEYAVRAYYGSIDSATSPLYYQRVAEHWTRWGKSDNQVAQVKADLLHRIRQKEYSARLIANR